MKAVLSIISALSFLFACAPAVSVSAQERRVYDRPIYGGFEVEVLVGGAPLERLYGRGRSYVEAIQGAEYELRVRNPLPVRVAVALSVDGLNTIDARRSSSWDSSKWVIEPYQTLRIGGWQMSTERARKFYFTTERDSYASKLGRASDLGVIAAVFYRESAPAITHRGARPRPLEELHGADGEEKRAENSPAPSASGSTSRQKSDRSGVVRDLPRDDEYAATGIGQSVSNHVQRINMSLERRPAAETTIRYEYRPALVRLGVLPRPRPVYDDPLRRRERAKGFTDSDFCPEP